MIFESLVSESLRFAYIALSFSDVIIIILICGDMFCIFLFVLGISALFFFFFYGFENFRIFRLLSFPMLYNGYLTMFLRFFRFLGTFEFIQIFGSCLEIIQPFNFNFEFYHLGIFLV